MDKATRKRFWKDLIVPTQEQTNEVLFANPSDVARSFVKARNWHATVSESLTEANRMFDLQVEALQDLDFRQDELEKVVIARVIQDKNKLPTSAVKNKQTLHMYAFAYANTEELAVFEDIKNLRKDALEQKAYWSRERSEFEIMRRTVEKSTEWLSQYINWYKFELREKV
jgi:hypothetical protein